MRKKLTFGLLAVTLAAISVAVWRNRVQGPFTKVAAMAQPEALSKIQSAAPVAVNPLDPAASAVAPSSLETEITKKRWDTLLRTPIRFYGKVVDEHKAILLSALKLMFRLLTIRGKRTPHLTK